MSEYVLILIFLNLVAFVAIKVWKKIFLNEHHSEETSSPIKRIGEPLPAQPQTQSDSAPFYEPSYAPDSTRQNTHSKSRNAFMQSVVFAAITGILVFNFHDEISAHLPAATKPANSATLPADMIEPETPTFTAEKINIVNQTKVDGVYWYEVSGLNTGNEKVQGWFTEFSLKPEPAKESKAIDSISKKLGLPTTEERVTYIKKLKKINSALKTALEKN